MAVPEQDNPFRPGRGAGQVCVDNFEYLRLFSWGFSDRHVSRKVAFRMYEANWWFLNFDRMAPEERDLIDALKRECGNGLVLA